MHSFTQAKTTTANLLVLYHACFAVPNTTTASLCGDVLRLSCDHELNSCKLFGAVPCSLCRKELNCKGVYFRCLFFGSFDVCGDSVVVAKFEAHLLAINAPLCRKQSNNCQLVDNVLLVYVFGIEKKNTFFRKR